MLLLYVCMLGFVFVVENGYTLKIPLDTLNRSGLNSSTMRQWIFNFWGNSSLLKATCLTQRCSRPHLTARR